VLLFHDKSSTSLNIMVYFVNVSAADAYTYEFHQIQSSFGDEVKTMYIMSIPSNFGEIMDFLGS
jgi:hypothetical protein